MAGLRALNLPRNRVPQLLEVDAALEAPELMLVDHANCEKKAASTALNLMREDEVLDAL